MEERQNFDINLDMTALGGVVKEFKGKSGNPVRCLVLPMVYGFYENNNGKVYMDLVAIERATQYSTHFVKIHLSKEQFETMTEEQRKALPIVGNMKPMVSAQVLPPAVSEATQTIKNSGPDDMIIDEDPFKLPF